MLSDSHSQLTPLMISNWPLALSPIKSDLDSRTLFLRRSFGLFKVSDSRITFQPPWARLLLPILSWLLSECRIPVTTAQPLLLYMVSSALSPGEWDLLEGALSWWCLCSSVTFQLFHIRFLRELEAIQFQEQGSVSSLRFCILTAMPRPCCPGQASWFLRLFPHLEMSLSIWLLRLFPAQKSCNRDSKINIILIQME